VGVALQAAGVAYADAIAALVVVLFLVWAGIEVTINGVKVLLDASIEQDVLFRAREIAQEHKGVRDVLAVEGRNSGSYRFLNLSLIPRTRDLAKAKNVADEVRDSIAREIPNVDRVRIDLQPQARESVLCAIPLEGDGVTVSKHFGEVEKFAFTNIKLPGGEIIGRESIGNPYSDLSRGKGVKVAEFLAQQGVELILVRESLQGKGAYYALETYGIQQLLRPEAERLRDAEELLAQSLAETEVQTGVDDSPS
jgi:predicted Fe-Mo cluster-binding NifX family protein